MRPTRQPAAWHRAGVAPGAAIAATLALLLASGAAAQEPAAAASAAGAAPAVTPDDDPRAYVEFVEEPGANCVARNGMQILVRNRHPSRTLRVWLDRTLAGNGTGDRSRSELKPGAEPEPLGCSRVSNVVQAWRVARAVWLP